MKYLLRYLAFALMVGNASAQSSLPACRTLGLNMFKRIFVLSLFIFLSFSTLAIPSYSRLSTSVEAQDRRIEAEARSVIYSLDPEAFKKVSVNSYNGQVLLTGEVGDQEKKKKIILEISRKMQWLRLIVDEVSVGNSQSGFFTRDYQSEDLNLIQNIKKFLNEEFSPNAMNLVKVVAFQGKIFLLGIVSNEEGSRITEIVRSTRGVKAVVRVFEYKTFAQLALIEDGKNESQSIINPSSQIKEQVNSEIGNVALVNGTSQRIALVVGNANYKVRPLKNPLNDADDISRSLRSSGFEVIDLRDASLQQMRNGVRQFGDRLINNDVGLVYYSGHGVEVKGRNYFIPVNADIMREDEIADQGLDVSLILEKMNTAGKGVNILIVDACRDDPFGRSFRSSSRGLAQMDAPRGTIIAYATSPGKVASDGDGRNSPYTKNLVKAMQQPNKPIEQVFKEVRRAVQEETKNQQTPWENTSLSGDFYFKVQR
jgi:osmotically-inducible protein OsmY